jgi:hypothetical protein
MNNKKYINEILYFSFIFLIFIFISINLAIYFDIDRHWTNIYDQEFTLAYNALLFNNGILQEFLDHSGYFTILFLSIFIKISQIFQIIDVYNLRSLLEYENIDEPFQNIISLTRIYSGLSVAIWCMAVNLIFYYISKSKLCSFLLSIIIFSFPGTIFHIYQLRTELLASFFMILALLMMINFLDANDEKHYVKKLFLFFIFIFCAILNKSQVFLFFFGLVFLSLFFHTSIRTINFDFIKKEKFKIYLFYTYLVILIYLFYKISIFNGTYYSLFFISFNIIIFNFIFYYLSKRSNVEPFKFLLNTNLILIFSFVILKLILFSHPSTNEKAFINTIINIMGIARYTTGLPLDGNATINFFQLIQSGLNQVFEYYLLNINIFSVLITAIIALSLIFRKKIGNKLFFFNLSCVVMTLSFTFISSVRTIQIVYHIFWDFFLLIPFCIFYKKLSPRINYSIIIPLLLTSFYFNYYSLLDLKKYSLTDNNELTQIIKVCEMLKTEKNNYMEDFHKKIPREKFITYCSNT